MRLAKPTFRILQFVTAALGLLLFSTLSFALDPNRSLRDFGHQTWLTESGLPQNTVQSIIQTRDGYIWIATQEGLARFDSLNFVVFDKDNTPQFTSNDIRFLFEDKSGVLWISTSNGLIQLQQEQFKRLGINEGLPATSFGPIAESPNGDLWIGTSSGLVHRQGEKFTTYTTSQGLASNVVQNVFAMANGRILISTMVGLQEMSDGRLTALEVLPELKDVTAIERDARGHLWLGTLNGLVEYDAGKTTVYSVAEGLPNNRISALRIDRAGALWIGTSGGLARFHDGRFETLTTAGGLSSNLILNIFEDREGNIWIGTEAGGLNLLKGKKFTTFTTRDGLSSDLVKAIYQDPKGGIWIGTNGGGLSLLKDGKLSTWTTREGLSSDVVLSLTADNSGNLWVGTPDGLNLFRDGKFKIFTVADGLSNDLIRSVFVDRSGDLWVGTREGLNSLHDGRFTTFTTSDGLANNFIGAIYQDSKGNLWIGTLGGLSRFTAGKFQTFTTKEGLSSDTVICLYEDAEGDLWIGTNGGGLNRLRSNKFVSFTTQNGLPDDVIYRILEDRQQNLWFSSNKGIFRIRKNDLEAVANGSRTKANAILYGPADGMLTRECSGGGHPSAWQTSDGRLWFATVKGIALIDPSNIPVNLLPPPLTIEQVLIDNKPVKLGQPITAPSESTRFDFYYAALSFMAPENVRFKYKLEGFDPDWIDGGSRRVAYYTNLRPGNYRFHVIAANNDGVWNEQGAVVDFYLKPHFYQTYWFYLICAVLLAGLIWQVYRLRVRQMASQFSAVLAERNRIAREIHDNLAQDILGISVQLELVTRLLTNNTEKAKAHLDRARILVRNSMSEARRYVWDLRSQELEKKDLPAALGDIARRLTSDTEVQTVVQVSGTFRPLSASLESNLLRIGQEAINNALKHARAQHIFINLNFEQQQVRLSVRDDGCGFSLPVQDSNGHFGLISMRERAQQVGGKLLVNSDIGSGTEIVIEAPIKD